jgi:hypothetical protein
MDMIRKGIQMSEHTPGPWRITRGVRVIQDTGKPPTRERRIADVSWEEDARLIAAAPDLLEAARLVRDAVAPMDMEPAYQALESAIAKAEGSDR